MVSVDLGGAGLLSLEVAPEGSLRRRTTLGEERQREVSFDRAHLPLALRYDHAWDASVLRLGVRLGVLDEGRSLTHSSVFASWVHSWGAVHTELGVGLFAGRPSEHTFLGTYKRTLVSAWPRLDLWWQG